MKGDKGWQIHPNRNAESGFMETYLIKKLATRNYKNLRIEDGLQFNNLNIFIGPNGSGKSNLINVLKFLRDSVTMSHDEVRGRTGFEDAVFELGSSKILDGTIRPAANVKFEFEFELGDYREVFELQLLVQNASKPVIVNQELLYSTRVNAENESLFYFYKCHDKQSGLGVISVYDDSVSSQTHFEDLVNVPVNQLALVTIPELLENNKISFERTPPIYQVRRQLIDTVSQWRFYNANNMNLERIRFSEPKIGQGDKFLSPSGENLPLVLHNLIQDSLDFEEQINNAMKAILPMTRKIRSVSSGRLSLTIEWHLDNMREPFYLNEMSDGTVRMLSWATLLHSPMLPTLLVLEEPELGVHVAWLPILAEWIKEASKRTQVILSTHSPDLLDHFTDQIERVSVFHTIGSDKNHFGIKPLLKESVVERFEEGWQLGDLYRVGDPSVGGWPW